MDDNRRRRWTTEVLSHVLTALAQDPIIRDAFILKGAWVLNFHLDDDRRSLDIDANASPDWTCRFPDLDEQVRFVEEHLPPALKRYFEHQEPVRFTLERTKVTRAPLTGHPRGWDALKIRLTVQDHRLHNVLGLPPVEIDVAAPEELGPGAVETTAFFGGTANLYALHRIAGEKLRAYLTSLPLYRTKMGGGEREFRVKDLHDLARILRARPISDSEFWQHAAAEFKLACRSRLVACHGLKTFMQSWDQARIRYDQDANLEAVPFSEAEQALRSIVGYIETAGILPLDFPI